MMIFNSGLVGHEPNIVVEFSGGDGKATYLENLKKQPHDWYYRNRSISYQYNDLGHRSKSMHDINLDDYILFTGCSHTEGVGLELEKTYPYLVANELKCDYYNLALGGTGIDIMTYNLICWLSKCKKLPKALVIQWPEFTRFSLCYEHGVVPYVLTSEPDTADITRFMVLGDDIGFFQSRKDLSFKMISALYDCNIIHVRYGGYDPEYTDVVFFRTDLARDLGHAGIEANQNLTNDLIPLLR